LQKSEHQKSNFEGENLWEFRVSIFIVREFLAGSIAVARFQNLEQMDSPDAIDAVFYRRFRTSV